MKRKSPPLILFLKKAQVAILGVLLFPLIAFVDDELPCAKQEAFFGTFRQQSPMAWEGEMLVILCVPSSESYPQPLQGLVAWPDLGGARTEIVGTRHKDRIEFTETRCIKTSCSRLLLGGVHRGSFNSSRSRLSGTATHSSFGLRARYDLKQVR